MVAYSDNKIVGFCNLVNGEMDPESAYVGLLGVNPYYQGQGFGKALLIESAETAVKAGFRRVDLHTWGGNLKAMPLYKRVGFNWVPGTRVLMESHIPGIIGCQMFEEFFNRHYWYDSFKRKITQEIDDITDDGLGVYSYHFEGDNADTLDVLIDREAKGICGFSMKLDGETISVSIRPKKHVGFIGYGEYPFQFKISYSGNSELSYSLQAIIGAY